jgi:hypothetical protein
MIVQYKQACMRKNIDLAPPSPRYAESRAKVELLHAAARARAREGDLALDVPTRIPTHYNSDEDDVPVFEQMKAEFPGLTFEFDENAHEPSFRWKVGVYESKLERVVLPGSGQPILLRNFRVVAHSATRKGLVRELRGRRGEMRNDSASARNRASAKN